MTASMEVALALANLNFLRSLNVSEAKVYKDGA